MMMKISVIIPVYNTARYLDDCIRSVVNQTYKDWECILVDDGSTDGSGDICDAWAGEVNRIKVIHKNNGGVSSARNCGLNASVGEWIVFIDSDDWVELNYLEELYFQINADKSDLALCGIVVYRDGKAVKNVLPNEGLCRIHADDTNLFLQIESQNLLYGPVNKIYRREIIAQNHIEFDLSVDYGEDLEFNFAYLQFVKKISALPLPMYYYRITSAPRLSTKFREDIFSINYKHWLMGKEFHLKTGMYNKDVSSFLYERLWGNVYDGIFLLNSMKLRHFTHVYRYVKKIVSIPEIEDEEFRNSRFCVSRWIKTLILCRSVFLLTIYFCFKKT